MKPRKAYKPKPIRIPMSKSLYDEFGMQMHTALASLRLNPTEDQFCALATIMNVVSVAIQDDSRFDEYRIYVNTGISMMNQISNKCAAGLPLKVFEIASLTIAVSAIDEMLPRMDVTKLHLANMTLKGLRK
jgi:hypothetical protein